MCFCVSVIFSSKNDKQKQTNPKTRIYGQNSDCILWIENSGSLHWRKVRCQICKSESRPHSILRQNITSRVCNECHLGEWLRRRKYVESEAEKITTTLPDASRAREIRKSLFCFYRFLEPISFEWLPLTPRKVPSCMRIECGVNFDYKIDTSISFGIVTFREKSIEEAWVKIYCANGT